MRRVIPFVVVSVALTMALVLFVAVPRSAAVRTRLGEELRARFASEAEAIEEAREVEP